MRGDEAEEQACTYLRAQGYRIVARNWRTRSGEIDIVARDRDVLVFVEVKARADDRFGGPEGAVDRVKQQRMIRTAGAFLQATECELPARFDVVAIRPDGVHLIRDAFWVSD